MRSILDSLRVSLALPLVALGIGAGCGDMKSSKIDVSEWTIELTAEPQRDTYLPGERVFIDARVYTKEGALVGDPPLIWEATGAVEQDAGVFELARRESVANIRACLERDETQTCGEIELPLDIDPPTLTITSPTPGAELLRNEQGGVRVEGTVVDSNPEARLSVYVNGIEGDIAGDGSFQIDVPAGFGVHHLATQASDGFHQPTNQYMNVLVANDYLPPAEGTTRFDLEDVVTLRLSQVFFDRLIGGTVLDLGTNPIRARDLASMVELLLHHIELDGLFGDEPIEFDDAVSITIGDLSIGDAVVDIALLDTQGIRLDLAITDVFVALDGWVEFVDIVGFTIDGGVAVDIRGTIELLIQRAPDGSVQSSLSLDDLGLSDIRPHFVGQDGDVINALVQLGTVQQTFRGFLEEQLEGPLVNEFLDVVPTTIVDLLDSISGLLDGIEFELDTGILPTVTLMLGAELGGLNFQEHPTLGYLDVTLNASTEVVGDRGAVHSESRGVAIDVFGDEVPLDIIGAAQIAIRQEFINGLLHSIWNAGLLDADIAYEGISVGLVANLPPVLALAPLNTDCIIEGERCDALLQIGQLDIIYSGRTFHVFLEAGASLRLINNEIRLMIAETPRFEVWSDVAYTGFPQASTIEILFNNMIWDAVTDLLGDGGMIAIPIPIPPPAELGLGDIAPGLAAATLELEAIRGLRFVAGFVGMSLDLVIEVPAL